MKESRLHEITEGYSSLRIALVGDFCLDRYFEIDPAREEVSIETGLPVHNVTNVRCQPGGAGTILNNLVALGVREIYPVGFSGEDGEGFELKRAMERKDGVHLDFFATTPLRRTFTYSKPLLMHPGKAPFELNRLDTKNWSSTPEIIQDQLIGAVESLVGGVDAFILLDQVDIAETGVVTSKLLAKIRGIAEVKPDLLILADSRRGLKGYPPVCFKMNRAELAALTGKPRSLDLSQVTQCSRKLAAQQHRAVYVTLAEEGLVGATPAGESWHVPALPIRGEIDIVGAGDAVTANLTAALSARSNVQEALEIAAIASSIVIHQLGTTGTATIGQIKDLWRNSPLNS